MRKLLFVIMSLAFCTAYGQVTNTDTVTNEPLNSVANIIAGNSAQRVTLGTYAQIDYNQPLGDTVKHNGTMDVHRLVVFMGYKFNDRAHFVTEIELEHVKEIFVEQAFLNYRLDNKGMLNLRTGLLLIPMGIINEYHEPPTYNGVERPNLDGKIIPTTWREMGAGFAGKLDNVSLRYQLYVVNGFNGYDGSGTFRGSDGLRKGRQKAAESFISSPNFSGKVDWYGMKGLKVGLSGYFGSSQSKAFEGLDASDATASSTADSTVLGIAMYGLDARYNKGGFQARGQFIYSTLTNSSAYNLFTGADVGSAMKGYYAELGYDVLRLIKKNVKQQLILFGRYENYNTHDEVVDVQPGVSLKNDAYNRTDITLGFGYKIAYGAVLKGDYQILSNAAGGEISQLNFGVGIWF